MWLRLECRSREARDTGRIYNGRQEKNDNLDLALALAIILEQERDIPVIYTPTRSDVVFRRLFEKGGEGPNRSECGIFLFHFTGTLCFGAWVRCFRNREPGGMKIQGQRQCWREISMKKLKGAGLLRILERERDDAGRVVLKRTRMHSRYQWRAGIIDNDGR